MFSGASLLAGAQKSAQKAPSIGIQATLRSNWYSKQVDQKVINLKKQIDTDLFHITPANEKTKPAECGLCHFWSL
ncbi:hypothetical protein [Pseudomonas asplenii]|uniref:hypothetical protein n=1 Tax=Pseudomonas asplenii TaxID=53407 RepID=UPI00235E60BF|nr:hypothetical protein [Pseudomonas asplenii]